jgi:pyruvate dehydrogenase E2 component (dihydrolipoamide acetyltransferase)
MAEARVEVPDIGDASDVDVVEVLVKPGAQVEKDQGLCVLETNKASMEVPSPRAGTVKSVALKVGDKVSQGTLILVLEEGDAGADRQAQVPAETPKSASPPAAPASAPKPPDKAPAPAERKPPAAPEPASPAPDSDRAEVPGPTRTQPPPVIPSSPSDAPPPPREHKPHATPSIRRFARDLGIDLAHVPGTGPRQRITKDDVQRYVKHAMSVAGTATGTGFAVPELPEVDFSQFGEIELQPLTKIQKLSGRNLHRSWVTIPHVTQFDEADITELEAFRRKMRADRPDLKLTLTTFFMKAVVVLLKQMPRFNSSLDRQGESLILKRYYHIGVAVDTPNGLVVPVIRDVESKGLHELASELTGVSERARSRRLTPQDLQGASFTISSLGGIGGTHFTPIINPPEVAVLGVSRAAERPVYVDGELVPRLICGLSLSYDHRVIDGADGARFTTQLREVLADIRHMLL